jgi:COP9 signalosome complex subunit 2
MSDEDEYEYEYDSDASMMEDDDDNNNNDGSDEDEFVYTDDEEDGDDGDGDDDENGNRNGSGGGGKSGKNYKVAIENEYYNAKGEKDDDKTLALEKFETVIQMEADHNSNNNSNIVSWTFKALKQSMKVRLQYHEYKEAREVYGRLLECISNPRNDGVSPNAVEKGINGMLERVSALLFQLPTASFSMEVEPEHESTNNNKNQQQHQHGDDTPHGLAWYVYDTTLELFHPKNGAIPNERLWYKTNLKYGQLLYENHQTTKLKAVIQDLLSSSSSLKDAVSHASSSSSSSTNLMEIYALQIQLYSRTKDIKKLRVIYTKAMQIRGGIPHPRTLALIQELGGKMHMSSREYEAANTAFFQAFKSYDEAGDIARLRCLKYLVLASMLHASSINPFDSQEVRPYKEDPEIVAMTKLVDAFHNNDIETFEKILNRNEGKIMDDEFIATYLADLLRTIRMQVLQEVLRPYTRISIEAVSKKLNGIPLKDVENLLVTAILDGKLDGRIDQVNGILFKNTDSTSTNTLSGAIHGNGNQSNMDTQDDQVSSSGGDGQGNDSNNIDGNTIIPVWGANSISVRTCTAMENLIDQLETVTLAVTAANSKVTGNNMFSMMK